MQWMKVYKHYVHDTKMLSSNFYAFSRMSRASSLHENCFLCPLLQQHNMQQIL